MMREPRDRTAEVKTADDRLEIGRSDFCDHRTFGGKLCSTRYSNKSRSCGYFAKIYRKLCEITHEQLSSTLECTCFPLNKLESFWL